MASHKRYYVLSVAVCILAVGSVFGDKKDPAKKDPPPRITAEECERLIKDLVNPGKVPFTGRREPILPKGVSERALKEKQKKVGPAYDRLSKNIEAALPTLVKYANDRRFSYVYVQPSSGVYLTETVGGACSTIIHEHVEVYRKHVTRYRDNEGRSDSVFFIFNGCGGIDKWWMTRKNKSLAELQLEGIEWALRQKKPFYFKSDEDWAKAKRGLEALAKEIRDTGKPIKVNHELGTDLEGK